MCVSKPVYSCELDQFDGVGMFCQMWALCEAFRKWNGFGDDVIAEQPSHPCLHVHSVVFHVTPFVHPQSSVTHHACVHKATLLQSAMSLTNGQLRPPRLCGRASVARSTIGRRLLPSGSFHKNSVMFLSNRHSARDGAGAAEST